MCSSLQLKYVNVVFSPAFSLMSIFSSSAYLLCPSFMLKGDTHISFFYICRWENPLMGWTSTGDPYANVGDSALSFESEEAAKAFAEKHGWEYTVQLRVP